MPDQVEHAADQRLYPDLPCFTADDAAFRVAVRAGIASFEAGPTYDMDMVEAELRDIIHGKG